MFVDDFKTPGPVHPLPEINMVTPRTVPIENASVRQGWSVSIATRDIHVAQNPREPRKERTPLVASQLTRRSFLHAGAAVAGALCLSASAVAEGKKWRIAVIGQTGHGNYGHGLDTCWLAIPETTVVAFADADEGGRRKEQAKLPNVRAYADYHQMLREVKPDVVAVAPRWIDQHAEMMLAAIEAGARGIYVEKPFCRTPVEADRILAAARKSGCRIAVAHRNRYHPALFAVQKAVTEGAIGTLLELRGRGKEDHRGGCLDLWVLGSHVFDLARFFAGNPQSCSALIQQGDRPARSSDFTEGAEGVGPICGDRIHARFNMQNGLPFYFDSIRNAGTANANFGLQLIGNLGVIDLRIDREPVAHLLSGCPFLPSSRPTAWVPISSAGVNLPEPLKGLGDQVASHERACRDLLAAISEQRPAKCSDVDGAATVEMIHGIYQSHVRDEARVPFPLKHREHIFETWKSMS